MRIEVRDLELVLALAEAGSTVRAASRLHLTQSAVSRGLLSVEDKLGVRLFERGRHGLAMTAAGRRLIQGAGDVLSQLSALEQATCAPDSPPLQLRLVCECYTAYRWLPTALQELRRTAPRLEVTLAFEHTLAPVSALLAGDVDAALLTTARAGRGIVEEPLFGDEVVFLLAPRHPLADRAMLTSDDVRRTTIITSTSTPTPEARWFFGQVFGRAAARTLPHLELLRFPLTEAIIDAARAGLGVAVMSEWIAAPYVSDGDLVVRRLRGKPLRRPWRIAYRRDSAAAARQLATLIAGRAPHLPSAPPLHAGRTKPPTLPPRARRL